MLHLPGFRWDFPLFLDLGWNSGIWDFGIWDLGPTLILLALVPDPLKGQAVTVAASFWTTIRTHNRCHPTPSRPPKPKAGRAGSGPQNGAPHRAEAGRRSKGRPDAHHAALSLFGANPSPQPAPPAQEPASPLHSMWKPEVLNEAEDEVAEHTAREAGAPHSGGPDTCEVDATQQRRSLRALGGAGPFSRAWCARRHTAQC